MPYKYLVYLFFLLLASCTSQSDSANLKLRIELLDNSSVRVFTKDYKYEQLDSVLLSFKSTIPDELKDDIHVRLIVNANITMGRVADVKNALRKSKMLSVTYMPKK